MNVFITLIIAAIVLAAVAIGLAIWRASDKRKFEAIEPTEEDEQKHASFQDSVLTLIILAAIIAAICACFAVYTAFADSQSSTQPASQAQTQQVTAEDINQAQQDLTVDLERLTTAKYDGISWVLLDSSLSPKDAARTAASGFSDALTMPFAAGDDAGKIAELQEEILRNPVYGVGFANFLQSLKVGDKTLGELNPWMADMATRGGGVTAWLTYRNGDTSTIYVTEEYRQNAAALCTLLERLVSQGVQTRQTSENWCLNAALKSNDRKAEKANYQYEREALVMSYVAKSGSELLTIGFNIHDKRYELFADVTPTGETPSNPGGGYTPPSNPDNPPYNPPDNPDTPNMKDPDKDPVNQKNGPVGGGTNDDPGPGSYEAEDHPATSSGASPDAGNDDGSGKPSNQIQNPGATQDGSNPPSVNQPIAGTGDNATGNNGADTNVDKTKDGVVVLPD